MHRTIAANTPSERERSLGTEVLIPVYVKVFEINSKVPLKFLKELHSVLSIHT